MVNVHRWADTREVFIPNNEILDEFKNFTESEEWVETFTAFQKSQELLAATWGTAMRNRTTLLRYGGKTAAAGGNVNIYGGNVTANGVGRYRCG